MMKDQGPSYLVAKSLSCLRDRDTSMKGQFSQCYNIAASFIVVKWAPHLLSAYLRKAGILAAVWWHLGSFASFIHSIWQTNKQKQIWCCSLAIVLHVKFQTRYKWLRWLFRISNQTLPPGLPRIHHSLLVTEFTLPPTQKSSALGLWCTSPRDSFLYNPDILVAYPFCTSQLLVTIPDSLFSLSLSFQPPQMAQLTWLMSTLDFVRCLCLYLRSPTHL